MLELDLEETERVFVLTFTEVGLLLLVFTRCTDLFVDLVAAGFEVLVLLEYPLVVPREVEE